MFISILVEKLSVLVVFLSLAMVSQAQASESAALSSTAPHLLVKSDLPKSSSGEKNIASMKVDLTRNGEANSKADNTVAPRAIVNTASDSQKLHDTKVPASTANISQAANEASVPSVNISNGSRPTRSLSTAK